MPRLMLDGRWFDPVSARSLYEKDYENALLAHSTNLFPGYRCVAFKVAVESEYGTAIPDLALIDLDYRSWYVVEVELDTHPLKGHVEEQVRKFAAGTYNEDHAYYLHKQASDLSLESLRQMLLGDQPRVLVLVTSHKPDWAPALAQYGAQVGVVEMYRDDLDRVLFRVNGEQPSYLQDEFLSECLPNRILPNALRLQSPAPFVGMDEIELLVQGATTTWRIHRVADVAFLTPSTRYPLETRAGQRLIIVKRAAGVFELVEGH